MGSKARVLPASLFLIHMISKYLKNHPKPIHSWNSFFWPKQRGTKIRHSMALPNSVKSMNPSQFFPSPLPVVFASLVWHQVSPKLSELQRSHWRSSTLDVVICLAVWRSLTNLQRPVAMPKPTGNALVH